MRLLIRLVLFSVLSTALLAREAAPAQAPQAPTPAVGVTNRFVIHLQEGFCGKRQVVITVDGLEVYKARPKTSEVTGLAKMVSVTNASAHPVVRFSIPSSSLIWSNRMDLASGSALGFKLTTNGQIRALQSTNFFYD